MVADDPSSGPPSLAFVAFLVFFAAMWVFVTTLLARKAGWPELVARYPDTDETPISIHRFQSGNLGPVSMSSILRLEPCPSGLRVGILRMFGPFSRDFFVPWRNIKIERTRRFIWPVAMFDFGDGLSR